jgi:exonuclease III
MYGFHGPNYITASACASSSNALADAFNLIRLGKANAIVAGGAEAAVCATGVGGFNAMKALSTRNDEPEKASRPFRLQAANRLLQAVDSLRAITPDAKILISGDFNDYHDSPAIQHIARHDLKNISKDASAKYGVKGTYRYKGEWNSLDHIFVSPYIYNKVDTVFIHSPKFLLEKDKFYGGYLPRRTYKGMKYQKKGFSDHLPLVARFKF